MMAQIAEGQAAAKRALAEAELFAAQKRAEAELFAAQKEAEGILAKANAQAEGLQKFLNVGDPDLIKFYMALEKNLYTDIAGQSFWHMTVSAADLLHNPHNSTTTWFSSNAQSGKMLSCGSALFCTLLPDVAGS